MVQRVLGKELLFIASQQTQNWVLPPQRAEQVVNLSSDGRQSLGAGEIGPERDQTLL